MRVCWSWSRCMKKEEAGVAGGDVHGRGAAVGRAVACEGGGYASAYRS